MNKLESTRLKKLDALVSEKVMGYIWITTNSALKIPTYVVKPTKFLAEPDWWNYTGKFQMDKPWNMLTKSFDAEVCRYVLADKQRLPKSLACMPYISLISYSSDLRYTFKMEERISELGLHIQYVKALKENFRHLSLKVFQDWNLLHATAEQRCKAALELFK